MSHPIWSNIFKVLGRKDSETEIALKQVPVFENLKRRELKEISKIVHKREFLKNENVFKINTPGLGMYVILKGAIEVSGEDGTQFAILNHGDFLGETALINEEKRSANAKALKDTSVIAFFRSDLLDIMNRNPVFGTKILFNLSNIMATRLKKTNKLLEKSNFKYKVFFPSKSQLDITNFKSIEKYLKKIKPKILVHMAALSRPMDIHDKNIIKSINLNILGTANITIACAKNKIKLIYFSTQYVYPGIKGNYRESDPLLPVNNYGWSKLGGEAAVQMYKNSLILRICMTEKPFIHESAFTDVKTNFIFHSEMVAILKKVLNKKGIINLGGPIKTVYDFAKKDKPNIKKILAKKTHKGKFPKNPSMNLGKLNKILK